MHPSFERWVDYVEGILPTPDRENVDAHRATDCESCREAEADVRAFLGALTGSRLLEPSRAAVLAAERAFHPTPPSVSLPAWARELREILGSLVFDSFARPEAAFAGARSASVARRLCYETDGVELDLLLESEGDVRRITGQLLVLGEDPRPLGKARFVVFCDALPDGEGHTDERGEFHLTLGSPGLVEIRVQRGRDLVTFRIPEPFFDAPED